MANEVVKERQEYKQTGSGLDVPEGYRAVQWAEVREGQVVWLAGKKDDKPVAYGPHEVYLVSRRKLVNLTRGRLLFTHLAEDLLVKEVTERKLFGGWKLDRVVRYLFNSRIAGQVEPTKHTDETLGDEYITWEKTITDHAFHFDFVIGYRQENETDLPLPPPHGWFYYGQEEYFWYYLPNTEGLSKGNLVIKKWLNQRPGPNA